MQAALKLPVACTRSWPGLPVRSERRQQQFNVARTQRSVFEATRATSHLAEVIPRVEFAVRQGTVYLAPVADVCDPETFRQGADRG